MKIHRYILPLLFFLIILILSSCTTGVTITASRLSGIIVDTSMIVDVGVIEGVEADTFREELLNAVRSNQSFGSPTDLSATPYASLLIEGRYTPSYDEDRYEEQVGKETRKVVEKTYFARFEYRIVDRESRELVVDGALEETASEKDDDEPEGFVWAVLSAIVDAIISPDPFSPLREKLVDRFIGEISPHELKVAVTLFEDSDMPELESGIVYARAGQWKSALGMFLDAIEKYPGHKNLHKAHYNAGVAYEYDHQYSLAWKFLERAVEMSAQSEYVEELARCRRYEQEWKWREGYLEKLRMMRKEGKE